MSCALLHRGKKKNFSLPCGTKYNIILGPSKLSLIYMNFHSISTVLKYEFCKSVGFLTYCILRDYFNDINYRVARFKKKKKKKKMVMMMRMMMMNRTVLELSKLVDAKASFAFLIQIFFTANNTIILFIILSC